MLYILLAETALEIVPGRYRGHSSVLNNAKKFGNPGRILDIALHHSFMKNLKHHSKRGRPDILHQYMITCLTSILCKKNKLRIYFHTYGNEIFEINPIMRPPKDYLRYKGLVYKLLNEKSIVIHKPNLKGKQSIVESDLQDSILIDNIRLSLVGLIKKIHPDVVYRFTSKGELSKRWDLFSESMENPQRKILCIVGGFQKGGFSKRIMDLEAKDISIYEEGLETNTVINHIINNFEHAIGI